MGKQEQVRQAGGGGFNVGNMIHGTPTGQQDVGWMIDAPKSAGACAELVAPVTPTAKS